MKLGLQGKVALVTGASRGMGAVIASELAAEGCKVVLVAMDQKKLDENVAQIRAAGGEAIAFSCDLRDGVATADMLHAAQDKFGLVDVVVANAGTAKMGPFLDLTDADWEEGYGVKLFGHMRLIRATWPSLKARHGAIVIIAGSAGRTPAITSSITGSVNAALLNLTKSLASLGLADGVRVNAINPGAIKTDRYQARIETAMQRLGKTAEEVEQIMAAERSHALVGESKDVAELVCFLASARARHLQGTIIDIDGGKTKTL